MAKKIDVGGELNSTTLDKKLVDAAQVKDGSRGEKTLVKTNEEIEYLLAQEGERQKQFEANEAARQAEADKTEQDRADEAARTEAERQATFEANEAERQVLYEKVEKNTEDIELLNANTGVSEYPEFSEAKAYAVGEVVLYEGLLKRFTSAHEAGAWDGSQVEDWSERKEVDGKVSELEGEVYENYEREKIIPSASYERDSVIFDNSKVSAGDNVTLSFSLIGTSGGFELLDIDGQRIELYITAEKIYSIEITENFDKAIAKYGKIVVSDIVIKSQGDSSLWKQIRKNEQGVKSNTDAIESLAESVNEIDSSIYTTESKYETLIEADSLLEGFVNGLGTISYDDGGFHTEYIDISDKTRLKISTSSRYDTYLGCFYNSSYDKVCHLEDYLGITHTRDPYILSNQELDVADIISKYPEAKWLVISVYPNKTDFSAENLVVTKTSIKEDVERLEEDVKEAQEKSAPLKGKTVTFYGDSITEGMAGTGAKYGWAVPLQRNYGMVCTNKGVGGLTLRSGGTKSIVERVIEDSVDSDYIIVSGGFNDSSNSSAIGELKAGYTSAFDASTTLGAMETMCKDILYKYADKKVGFVVCYNIGDRGGTYDLLADNLILACKKWGLPYLDLRSACGFNLAEPNLRKKYGMYEVINLYDESKGYYLDERVIYNGQKYKAAESIDAPAGTFNPDKWTLMGEAPSTPLFNYDSNQTYNIGDKVAYLGLVYETVENGVTGLFDNSKWKYSEVTDGYDSWHCNTRAYDRIARVMAKWLETL